MDVVAGGDRIESKFTDEQIAAAMAAANAQPKSAAIQNVDGSQKPVGFKAKRLVWSSTASTPVIAAPRQVSSTLFAQSCPGRTDHLIVVVNISFEIYDKQGTSLLGPVPFAQFFDGTPGCTAFDGAGFAGVFDPDVVYDIVNDRFILGIDGDGTDFCVAATQTGDPLGGWNRYGFPTNVAGAFFDFPHMGVGEEAIFMGSNQFGGALPYGFEGRVFAMSKDDMYSGIRCLLLPVSWRLPVSRESQRQVDGTPNLLSSNR